LIIPRAVSKACDKRFIFVNRREVNTEEAKFVLALAAVIVQKLVEELDTPDYQLSVGIITPYQKQKHLLLNLLQERSDLLKAFPFFSATASYLLYLFFYSLLLLSKA